jgi:hypothetical protein
LAITPIHQVILGVNVGYNNTSFDNDVAGGNGLLLHAAGDKIGGPAWTGSAYAEGAYPLTDAGEGYMRVDYSFQSKGYDPNPKAFGYDPGLPGLPASGELSLRAGVRVDRLDLSAFVDNALNSHKALSRSNDGVRSKVYYVESYRPRTIGITAIYQY